MNAKKIPKQLAGVGQLVLSLAFIALGLVLTGLVIAFGQLVNSNIYATLPSVTNSSGSVIGTSAAQNASNFAAQGVNNIAIQIPNVGLVIGAVAVLAVLFVGFGGFLLARRNGEG